MAEPDPADPAAGYLSVNAYIGSLVGARALKSAFELGLVDRLLHEQPAPTAALERDLRLDASGLALLLGLLEGHAVVERRGTSVSLQPAFAAALRYRELMEAKVDFAGFVLPDFAEQLSTLIREPASFMRRSRLFQLFDYACCFDGSIESYVRTKRWMRLTTLLTRYEAAACLSRCDVGAYRRLLDVGGNSGEFAVQACRRHPRLAASVVDLPLVCEIGMEHVLGEPECGRIGFIKADVRSDPLPRGHDLIAFKSMLHDWPDDDALRFIDKAVDSVDAGGGVLIFERSMLDAAPLGFADLPVLLFARSYRRPAFYVDALRARGLRDVACVELQLDTPFMLVTARKPTPDGTAPSAPPVVDSAR